MRILTPAEQREVERIKSKMTTGEIIGIDLYTEHDNLVVTTLNKELWLNILDLALQANDAMKDAWRRTGNPQQDELEQAIATKLRTNE